VTAKFDESDLDDWASLGIRLYRVNPDRFREILYLIQVQTEGQEALHGILDEFRQLGPRDAS
jgi:hypothetical protein